MTDFEGLPFAGFAKLHWLNWIWEVGCDEAVAADY
jgi:hypothetical protein